MKYLLDTQLVLWTLFDQERIPSPILGIFEDQSAIKFVSGVTLWEISLKYSLGKILLDGLKPELIQLKIEESGCQMHSIQNQELSTYYQLPKKENHKDPFDRLLIWQSILNDFTLLTTDSSFKSYLEDGLKLLLTRK